MICEVRKTGLGVMLLALLVAAPSVSAGFTMRAYSLMGVNRLALPDVARFYGMKFSRHGKSVSLTSQYSKLEFTLPKREFVLNDITVNLCHAITETEGVVLVSEMDFRKVLDPVLRKWSLPRKRIQRIVLDPGHGGRDPGCHGKSLIEKDLTLTVAKLVSAILRQHGLHVVLTREKDRGRDLEERTALAKKYGADLFISIHANAVGSNAISGIETFVLSPEGAPSTYSNRVNEKARSGNVFDKENMRLGYEIQRNTMRRTGADDRGVKHANFVVLRDAPCPATLVEIGFLTNRSEEFRLSTRAYQSKVALGIAEGVIAYRNAVAVE